ncbi:MAG: site-2 protease family protein [Candidatus Gracilibacteria bacterium]|jgi:regulator of sigma E protease
MYTFYAIVAFIVVFSALILVHELGHFWMAKRAGVKVEEFGIGMPPRIWGKKVGETIYSVNWIPFGGFVKMLGEDGTKAILPWTKKRSFQGQPVRKQILIVCGGVMMNLLLAFLLLTIGFVIGIEPLIVDEEDYLNAIRDGYIEVQIGVSEDMPDKEVQVQRLVYFDSDNSVFHGLLSTGDTILTADGEMILTYEDLEKVFMDSGTGEVKITASGEDIEKTFSFNLPQRCPIVSFVEIGSSAETSGLKAGDLVKSIDGVAVSSAEQIIVLTQKHDGKGSVIYEVIRDGETLIFTVPLGEKDGRAGVALADFVSSYGNLSLYSDYVPHTLLAVNPVRYGLTAPVHAISEMWRLGKMTAETFVGVLKQFLSAGGVPAGVTGPVGIAQMTYVILQDGFAAMIRFIALLSLSLGVINILPLPAMDGGHLFFLLYQGISGKKPNPKWENLIHTVGFFFLILLLVYVTFNDVLNLF